MNGLCVCKLYAGHRGLHERSQTRRQAYMQMNQAGASSTRIGRPHAGVYAPRTAVNGREHLALQLVRRAAKLVPLRARRGHIRRVPHPYPNTAHTKRTHAVRRLPWAG